MLCKVAVEYVKLCGYKNGENQWGCQNGTPKLSLDTIASQLGTSKRNLQRALSIERNLPPAQRLAVVDKLRKVNKVAFYLDNSIT